MTFFSPEFEGRMASMPGLPFASMFGSWVDPQASSRAIAEMQTAQLKLFESTLELMLLPFAALSASSAAPYAPPASCPPKTEPVAAAKAVTAAPTPPSGTEVPRPTAAKAPAPSAPQPSAAIPAAPLATAAEPAPAAAQVAASGPAAPALLEKPAGKPDDLLLIKGIGPKLNELLNSLGVWHYRQIVSWTPAEIAWVNAKIDFNGRIERERWQEQAAALMKPSKAA